MEDDTIDVCLIHPYEFSDADWLEIAKLSQKHTERGEASFMKCCVLGYVEWLSIEHIHLVKQ